MNEKKLDLILDEIKDVKDTVKNLEGSVRSLEGTVKNLEAMQRSQGEHIQQLIQIVGTTNAKVEELTEEVRQMNKVQQEQQKILERLSIRSISQEADIAELRRII